MKENNITITNRTENFINSSFDEVDTPIFVKIGNHNKIIKGFVYMLSLVSIIAGFSFWYNPILDITSNSGLAVSISLMILIIIEVASLLSFELSILEINRKAQIGGFLLLFFSVIILAFNMYTHAEGNKVLIKRLATKPNELKQGLTDTITILDSDFITKSEQIKSDYSVRKEAINRDFKQKIDAIDDDIKAAFDADGNLIDWRKNNESVKNKSLVIQNFEAEKQIILTAEHNELQRLTRLTDSLKNFVYLNQKLAINDVQNTADKSGKVAYWMGFILVFLIISVRLIALLSKIAAVNWAYKMTKDGTQFIVYTRVASFDEKLFSKLSIDRINKPTKNRKSEKTDTQKTELKPVEFEILNSSTEKK
jgi:hypothetical protein